MPRGSLKILHSYHNLSTTTIAKRRLADYAHLDQYDHVFSTSEQLCYQHENASDNAYWNFLINIAEKFFIERADELEEVCINRLLEASNSASESTDLTIKPSLDSETVSSIQVYGSENEDPLK
jgi:hypothetical protein